MIIVTAAELATTFQTLADWKTRKGVPTVVRTTDWIDSNYPAGHDQPERIRLFLRDAYCRWGAFLVLLGGDEEQVPARRAFSRFWPPGSGSAVTTDQYYACLEGDWNGDGDELYGEGSTISDTGDDADLLPDVFVGRAPVANVAEASTFVAKSLTYDRTPPAGYVEDVLFMAEVLFPADWEFGVDPPESIILDGGVFIDALDALIDPAWARTYLLQSEGTLTRATALAELNTGHHLSIHSGHGDAFKFSVGDGPNPLIQIADTDALVNGDRLAFMLFAASSSANKFDLETYGESLMNNPGGGAIAVVAPTAVDFPLSAAGFDEELMRLLFTHGTTRFGVATQLHRVPFVPFSQSDQTPDRWSQLVENLLGDPELRFWTEEPQTLLVSHPPSVPLGTSTITVTVTDALAAPLADALVTVSDGTGTYSRARTDAAGEANLALSSSVFGTVNVVVTKREFLPDEGSFEIDAIATPNLALTDRLIDDDATGASSGNGDVCSTQARRSNWSSAPSTAADWRTT